jgi:hypothetical protein
MNSRPLANSAGLFKTHGSRIRRATTCRTRSTCADSSAIAQKTRRLGFKHPSKHFPTVSARDPVVIIAPRDDLHAFMANSAIEQYVFGRAGVKGLIDRDARCPR